MFHNLTDIQLKNLRWLVQKVKDGDLEETFRFITTMDGQKIFFSPWQGKKIYAPDYVDSGAINALVTEDVLRVNFLSNKSHNYTLTRMAYEIETFDFTNPEPDQKRDYLKEVYRILDVRFNNSDLKTLCLFLDINPERVFVSDDPNWPRQLLIYLNRLKRLGDLAQYINSQRPDIANWPDYLVDEDEQ